VSLERRHAISDELQKKLKELAPGAIIGEGYGLSETIAHGALALRYTGTSRVLGVPQLNDIRIMDLSTGTKELGPNEEGEITIRDRQSCRVIGTSPKKQRCSEGWLALHGHIGLMDEEGYVSLWTPRGS